MNEHSFVKSIHRYLHPDVYKWKIHDTYTGGVPDAMYCGPENLLFVEYKYVKELPKKDTTLLSHSLTPLQSQWLNRINGPSHAALIIGVDNAALILVDSFSTNISKQRFEAHAVSRKDVAQWIYEVTCLGRNPEARISIYEPLSIMTH
jgi:hypothetical protein